MKSLLAFLILAVLLAFAPLARAEFPDGGHTASHVILDANTLSSITYYNASDTNIIFDGENLHLPFSTGSVIFAPVGPHAPSGISLRRVTAIQQHGSQYVVETELLKGQPESVADEGGEEKSGVNTTKDAGDNHLIDGM